MKTLKSLIVAVSTTTLISLPALAADKETESKEPKVEIKSVAEIFPEKLVNADGKEVSRDELKDKVVGVYFSAHWCPPCRTFTPKLVEFHEKNAGDDFEIVFVSLDKSEEAKADYIKGDNMQWLTVKGHRSDDGNALQKKYGVRGIPSLVILAPDGSTITPNGRADVSADPEAALKKWQTAASAPEEKKEAKVEKKAAAAE